MKLVDLFYSPSRKLKNNLIKYFDSENKNKKYRLEVSKEQACKQKLKERNS